MVYVPLTACLRRRCHLVGIVLSVFYSVFVALSCAAVLACLVGGQSSLTVYVPPSLRGGGVELNYMLQVAALIYID